MQYYSGGRSLVGFTKNSGCGVRLGLESEGRVLVGTKEWVVRTKLSLQTRGSGVEGH